MLYASNFAFINPSIVGQLFARFYFMKKILLFVLTGLALTTACKKDNGSDTPAIMQVSGTLNAAQTIPNVGSSNGSGTVTGTYDPTTKVLTYSVAYTGITPTAGHIHYGDPRHYSPTGVMVAFDRTKLATSPITGTATLTAQQADSLLAGHTYTNLHTQAHPADGELRANLTVK